MIRFSVLLQGLAMLGCLLGAPVLGTAQSETLTVELIVPINTPEGERKLSLERYPRIHVRLHNQGQSTIKLWKDWNTWGYYNLSLELSDAQGRAMPLKKLAPASWDGDFPDFWTLQAGESVIMEVDMRSEKWQGFPDLYGETLPAKLKVVYENKPDVLAEDFGIWVGKVESQEVSVIFTF